ncbi:hypothetical protein J6590_027996 [Homalodisca vitripennis]|nr:hypothetical protein J6590_027996 [Homalodisca vitripennis]
MNIREMSGGSGVSGECGESTGVFHEDLKDLRVPLSIAWYGGQTRDIMIGSKLLVASTRSLLPESVSDLGERSYENPLA